MECMSRSLKRSTCVRLCNENESTQSIDSIPFSKKIDLNGQLCSQRGRGDGRFARLPERAARQAQRAEEERVAAIKREETAAVRRAQEAEQRKVCPKFLKKLVARA